MLKNMAGILMASIFVCLVGIIFVHAEGIPMPAIYWGDLMVDNEVVSELQDSYKIEILNFLGKQDKFVHD